MKKKIITNFDFGWWLSWLSWSWSVKYMATYVHTSTV